MHFISSFPSGNPGSFAVRAVQDFQNLVVFAHIVAKLNIRDELRVNSHPLNVAARAERCRSEQIICVAMLVQTV